MLERSACRLNSRLGAAHAFPHRKESPSWGGEEGEREGFRTPCGHDCPSKARGRASSPRYRGELPLESYRGCGRIFRPAEGDGDVRTSNIRPERSRNRKRAPSRIAKTDSQPIVAGSRPAEGQAERDVRPMYSEPHRKPDPSLTEGRFPPRGRSCRPPASRRSWT